MHTTDRIQEVATALLSRPDEIMREVGASGELLAARLRAVVAAALLLLPLANALTGASIRETVLVLGATVAVNAFAQLWLALARRQRRFAWLPFVTAAFDVTATSLVLLVLAIDHLPAGLNSLIVWCGYLLAILLTALRSDGRVSLFAGALALLQYGALVLAAMVFVSSPEQLISSDYGEVTIGVQVQRLVLLVFVTAVTAMLVYRMQQLVEMSGTDGLTRLPNRTWLAHRMPRIFDAARADGGTLTLALLDLDHFSHINEEVGHRSGDRALRHFVSMVQQIAEPGEWLVRLGGEEFVLLLRKPIGTAWERVDMIRRMVAERPFEPDRNADPIQLTFSAGLASYPHEGADLSRLLLHANQRLQQAKRDGRNRVVARDA
jgi:diguanylate cyclase (GGDEF)-like protein